MVDLRLKVRTLDLSISSEARTLCLFGPSGSGKTTCLESVAGLLKPSDGLLRFDGLTLFGPGVNLPPRARGVGYLPQDAPLFPHLSVRENLVYGARETDPLPLARALGIDSLLDRRARKLSGGEQRRVALGRALLVEPSILLLDEPFSGLDAPLRARLLTYVAQLAVPRVLLVTHDPRDAIGLADEVVRIEEGREVERGTPGEIFGPDSDLVEPAALLDARVALLSSPFADVELGGLRLTAHLPGALEGETLRLAIRANEVTLALHRHEDLSARNQLEATILDLKRRNEQMLASLDAGFPLHALLDVRSAESLGLRAGSRVVAQFKATALRRAGL